MTLQKNSANTNTLETGGSDDSGWLYKEGDGFKYYEKLPPDTYTAQNNKITYSPAVNADTQLFTISGFKNDFTDATLFTAENCTVDKTDSEVTLKTNLLDNIGSGNLTLTNKEGNNYKFKIGDEDLSKTYTGSTVKITSTVTEDVTTYSAVLRNSGTNEGFIYTDATSQTIKHSAAEGLETVWTISGLNGTNLNQVYELTESNGYNSTDKKYTLPETLYDDNATLNVTGNTDGVEFVLSKGANLNIQAQNLKATFTDSAIDSENNNNVTIAADNVTVNVGAGTDKVTFDGNFTNVVVSGNSAKTYTFASTASGSITIPAFNWENDSLIFEGALNGDPSTEGGVLAIGSMTIHFGTAVEFSDENMQKLKITTSDNLQTDLLALFDKYVWKLDNSTELTFNNNYGRTNSNPPKISISGVGLTDVNNLADVVSGDTVDFSNVNLMNIENLPVTIKGEGYSFKLNSSVGQNAAVASQDTTVIGGGAADSFYVMTDNVYLNAGGEDDVISISQDAVTVLGGSGNDSFSFTADAGNNNVIDGGDGADSINTENISYLKLQTFDVNDVFLIDSSYVKKGSVALTDGKLTFGPAYQGGASLTLEFADKVSSNSVSDFYGLKIYNDNKIKTLGEFFMAGNNATLGTSWNATNSEITLFDSLSGGATVGIATVSGLQTSTITP